MTNLDDTFQEFSHKIGSLLRGMQISRTVNAEEIPQIEKLADSLADSLKHEDLLPRIILNEIRTAIRVLRAESAYSHNSRQINGLADRLDFILDLILMGETKSDRIPGKPRII